MIVHYVYVLYYKGLPIYVGMSTNPAKRLIDHFSNSSYPKVYKFFRKIKKVSDVSIVILQKYHTKKRAKCVKCTMVEQRWILKFLRKGHSLLNTVVAYNKYKL